MSEQTQLGIDVGTKDAADCRHTGRLLKLTAVLEAGGSVDGELRHPADRYTVCVECLTTFTPEDAVLARKWPVL